MKILFASDNDNPFLEKSVAKFCGGAQARGESAFGLLSVPTRNDRWADRFIQSSQFSRACRATRENRFEEMLRVAATNGFDHLHICFTRDLKLLARTLRRSDSFKGTLSVSQFGTRPFEREAEHSALMELLSFPKILSILFHSLSPLSAQQHVHRLLPGPNEKIRFVHEPIYDEIWSYRDGRCLLGGSNSMGSRSKKVKRVLYFGTYSRRKGVELLLEVARDQIFDDRVEFVFAGDLLVDNNGLTKSHFDHANTLLISGHINEMEAPVLFQSVDAVCLPYDGSYENDTSGVFVQSLLARKPLIVPAIEPFKSAVQEYGLGTSFVVGDRDSLSRAVNETVDRLPSGIFSGSDAYLNKIETWSDLVGAIFGQEMMMPRYAAKTAGQ